MTTDEPSSKRYFTLLLYVCFSMQGDMALLKGVVLGNNLYTIVYFVLKLIRLFVFKCS